MERTFRFRLAALGFFLGSFCTGASAAMVSSFNTSAEGWTVAGNSTNFAWESTGGNPGGFIAASDAGAGQWYFVAPSSWNGDWTSYISGALQFDVKILYPTTSPYDYNISPANVVIYSGSGNYASWSTNFKPTGSWTSFGVQLTPGNFSVTGTASFDQILANVTEVRILGEYLSGNDTEGLDNVSLTPVPLPSTALLFGSSLIGLTGLAKRKKSA